MIHIWQSIIFGIVEGVTEFLPISSTAHLILTNKLLGLTQTDFAKSFEIAIQLGAILSVVWLYWRKLLVNWETMKRITVAFLPTAVLGFLLYKVVKNYLLSDLSVVVWALLLGGIFLIVFEYWHKEKDDAADGIESISYKKCVLIGSCQAVAMIPGVSRAAATILGGLALGVKRTTIVEFSFLLAVPTMLAATAYDMLKTGVHFSGSQFDVLAVGFIVSFLVALAAIKFLLGYIKQHDFKGFGWYRIIIALIFLLVVL